MEQYFDYNHKYKVHDKLFTPLYGVKLTGGLFRKVFDNNSRFNVTQLDQDRLRYWFDIKRGIPTDAKPYTGHFEDNLKGQTASQYLMCAGNALRWEENEELRKGMEEIIEFLDDSQEDDGFLMPINKFDFAHKEYPGYVRIWLTYGLIAAARGGNKRAFKMLRLWQDWFNRCPDLPVVKYLELAFQAVVASPSVYATEIGVEDDMEKTIEYYEEDWRLAQFINYEQDAVETRRQHGYEPHPHGTELEGFEGYLDLYRYTAKPFYLNAVINCLDLYKNHWQHAGGGIVMCERISGGKGNGRMIIYDDPRFTYNELCASAFWLQIHQRLHRIYPHKENYVFEMEQSLYNTIIANQVEDTHIRSFAWLDGYKRRIAFPKPLPPNHCCAGMGTKIFASLPEYLYTMNKHKLSCDIYAGSELMWDTEIQTIKVIQETDFPYDGKVKITFEPEKPQDFTLRLRIPHYLESDVDVYLNGELYSRAERGTYLEIYRNWKKGDYVSFEMVLAFKEHLYYGDHDVEGYTRCAYTYGPILLTVVGEKNHENGIVIKGTPQEFIGKLRPQERPFYFDIEGEDKCYVAPYFEVGEVELHCYPMFEGMHKPEEAPEKPFFGVQRRPWIRD